MLAFNASFLLAMLTLMTDLSHFTFVLFSSSENHWCFQTKVRGTLRSPEPQMDQIFSQGTPCHMFHACVKRCGGDETSQGVLVVLASSCAVHVVSAEAACCLTRDTSRRPLPHWSIPSLAWEWCRGRRWGSSSSKCLDIEHFGGRLTETVGVSGHVEGTSQPWSRGRAEPALTERLSPVSSGGVSG